ncbi:hypothetical protein HT121_24175 [Pseudomonas sp. MAFF 301514]|uniref:DUF6957 domain-containing protein n=1 Tax=Pseudomonas allii TaxID=2740531 RepID=A0A7Y8UWK1_9PSED|nr:hypothetical protein [Pseudomonas allii]NWN50468.1 hypothetical protein [Pseudomonas allii]NWN60832.1 hypothetical protein [Pseudomonas allii]
MNLTQLAKLLGGQDASVDGCGLSAQEAALTAQQKFKSQPFCLVSEWTILDLEVDEDELNALRLRGLEPVIVYALHVLLDSRGRYLPGDWVRTSFRVSHEESGFFLTTNTVYVLLGKGHRQRISVDDLKVFKGH